MKVPVSNSADFFQKMPLDLEDVGWLGLILKENVLRYVTFFKLHLLHSILAWNFIWTRPLFLRKGTSIPIEYQNVYGISIIKTKTRDMDALVSVKCQVHCPCLYV